MSCFPPPKHYSESQCTRRLKFLAVLHMLRLIDAAAYVNACTQTAVLYRYVAINNFFDNMNTSL